METLNKEQFLELMEFPKEWLLWGMYPDELFQGQVAIYRPGDEAGSEHDRNGAFHWWLRRPPSKIELMRLVALSFLDSDEGMANDVRRYVLMAKNCAHDVRTAIEQGKS